jgi:tRNA/tmRNA/rRNA uracil-C5-methylase (TrmA/RlmC/RlmD family)
MVAPQEGRGSDEEIDARLVELHELLTQAGREGYGELSAALTAVVQRRGAQGGAIAKSLRRRRVEDMQSNMEQVTRNLVDLSQSVLACQRALQTLAEGKSSIFYRQVGILNDIFFFVIDGSRRGSARAVMRGRVVLQRP